MSREIHKKDRVHIFQCMWVRRGIFVLFGSRNRTSVTRFRKKGIRAGAGRCPGMVDGRRFVSVRYGCCLCRCYEAGAGTKREKQSRGAGTEHRPLQPETFSPKGAPLTIPCAMPRYPYSTFSEPKIVSLCSSMVTA